MTASDPVLDRVLAWAEAEPSVRLLVLTSTRARPDGPTDALSDYDLIVELTDLGRFDPGAAYRPPAASWGHDDQWRGMRTSFRGVVYTDGVKIDWSVWPVGTSMTIVEQGLDDNLDVGYRVLLDKDGTTEDWPAPTFLAHIPAKPTDGEYVALVEEFWWSATYIAKARARGELFFARFILDQDLTYSCLRRMLEWRIELDRDWNWKPGAYGRGIERELPSDIASELEAAHDSVERTIDLFRRVAREVGQSLGYAYPEAADESVSAYLKKVESATTS